jgi:hypothetical protein
MDAGKHFLNVHRWGYTPCVEKIKTSWPLWGMVKCHVLYELERGSLKLKVRCRVTHNKLYGLSLLLRKQHNAPHIWTCSSSYFFHNCKLMNRTISFFSRIVFCIGFFMCITSFTEMSVQNVGVMCSHRLILTHDLDPSDLFFFFVGLHHKSSPVLWTPRKQR